MGLQQGPLGRLITTKKLGHVDGAQTKKVIRLQKISNGKKLQTPRKSGPDDERQAPSCKGAKLMDGKVFKGSVGHQELAAWVEELGL